MAKRPGRTPSAIERSMLIAAPPTRIISAFFAPDALGAWWRAARSVTTPRPLGVYAVEWPATEFSDDVLGRLGGVFHGTVLEFKPGREFFIGDAYWLPPDGEPIGPMALEVTCAYDPEPRGGRKPSTIIRVRQSGSQTGGRWLRYCEITDRGWELALDSLRTHLESARAD
jgi:uncharacterized protein YndB with AHSA1/START domain